MGELFCGPGGIALGALNAIAESDKMQYRVRHAWATDYDPDTCATYTNNICEKDPESVICGDIRELDLDKLTGISEIDGLAFGFPCNDFSIVGEQKGMSGNFGPLYTYGVEVLKKCRPKWFLAENVGGLSNSNEGKAFKKILSELFNSGYSLYPHLYSFEEYGVPQARKRIIIIGIREDLGIEFKVPSPAPFRKVDVSVRNALENPPIPENALNNDKTRQSEKVIDRLRFIPPGGNAWLIDLLIAKTDGDLVSFFNKHPYIIAKNPDLDFSDARAIRKKLSSIRLSVKSARMSQIYKRLEPEKPSYTVTGSGGGGTHVYHWSEDRALTNRERARLQTFPDDFVFAGSKESVRKQIGMAVPCKGVTVIFNALLNCFAGNEYESIPCSIPPMCHDI